MKHYPSWRYHKELAPKLIKSEQEESPEWKDSPAHFEQKEVVEVVEEKEIKEVKKKSKKD